MRCASGGEPPTSGPRNGLHYGTGMRMPVDAWLHLPTGKARCAISALACCESKGAALRFLRGRKGQGRADEKQPVPPVDVTVDDEYVDENHRGMTLDEILDMSPYEFEMFVREALEGRGYRDLQLTNRSGDLGVDSVGRSRRGKVVAVQCKRYSPGSKITSPALQTFFGMAKYQYKADVLIFVTTSSFTRDAISVASDLDIELIAGPELVSIHASRGNESRPRRSPSAFRR